MTFGEVAMQDKLYSKLVLLQYLTPKELRTMRISMRPISCAIAQFPFRKKELKNK